MRLSTITGLVAIILVTFASIALRGFDMLGYFLDLPSAVLVFGSTFAVMAMQFTFPQMWTAIKAVKYTLVRQAVDPKPVIDILVEMAIKARREGFMSLRELSTNGKYPLLDIGIDLMADGTDPQVTRGIMDTVSGYIQTQIENSERFWKDSSVYAPMYGMIGTLIGLIMLLKTLTEPETIAPNMSLALVTTYYGIGYAGMIAMPLAGKIKFYNDSLALAQEIIIEGISSIQTGDNSQIVREKLQAFLAGHK